MLLVEKFQEKNIPEDIIKAFSSQVIEAVENETNISEWMEENLKEYFDDEFESFSQAILSGIEDGSILDVEEKNDDETEEKINKLEETINELKKQLEETTMKYMKEACPSCGEKKMMESKDGYTCEACGKKFNEKMKEVKENSEDFEKGYQDAIDEKIDLDTVLSNDDYRAGVNEAKAELAKPEKVIDKKLDDFKKEVNEKLEAILSAIKESKEEVEDEEVDESVIEDVKQKAFKLAVLGEGEVDVADEHKEIFESAFEEAKKAVELMEEEVISYGEIASIPTATKVALRKLKEEATTESFEEALKLFNESEEKLGAKFDEAVKSLSEFANLYLEDSIEICESEEDEEADTENDELPEEFKTTIEKVSENLTETQKIDLNSVVEGIEFEDHADFEKQLNEWKSTLEENDEEGEEEENSLKSRYNKRFNV